MTDIKSSDKSKRSYNVPYSSFILIADAMHKLSHFVPLSMLISLVTLYHLPIEILTVGLIRKADPDQVTFIIQLISVTFLVCLQSVTFYLKRAELNILFKMLKNRMFDYDGWGQIELDNIKQKYARYMRNVFSLWILFTNSGTVFGIFSTYIDEEAGFNVIRGMKNNINFDLIFPFYYPYGTSKFFYWFSILLQFLVSVFTCVQVVITIFLFIFLATEISINLEHLIASIDSIDSRMEFKKSSNSARLCISESIKHHQQIIIFFKIFEDIYMDIIYSYFLIGEIIIAMAGVTTLQGYGKPSFFIFNVLLAVILSYVFGVFCWYGQNIHDLSENLGKAMYFTKWYNNDQPHKKSGLIIMAKSIRPLQLNAHIKEINLETFAEYINTCYSYFSFINSLKNSSAIN